MAVQSRPSYATGAAAGGDGDNDSVGELVGYQGDTITASYGFGVAVGEVAGLAGSTKPVGTAAQLTAANAGPSWNNAGNNSLDAWDFGTETQIPALKYGDYDDGGAAFGCGTDPGYFPANACGTLLPGQDEASAGGPASAVHGQTVTLVGSLRFGRVATTSILSWSWRQLAGAEVTLTLAADGSEAGFTAPLSKEPLLFELTATDSEGRQYRDRLTFFAAADNNGDGLIEIYSLAELHNMRYDLAGTSYKSGAAAVGNSYGCPETGCRGYELWTIWTLMSTAMAAPGRAPAMRATALMRMTERILFSGGRAAPAAGCRSATKPLPLPLSSTATATPSATSPSAAIKPMSASSARLAAARPSATSA